MSIQIPAGSYVVMNAMTHTYLDLLNFDSVPASIVLGAGNYLGNDIWTVGATESNGLTIQSFGTGAFVFYSIADTAVVSSNTIYAWTLKENTIPYAWEILDSTTELVLDVEGNSTTNGASVVANKANGGSSQAWFFVSIVPLSTSDTSSTPSSTSSVSPISATTSKQTTTATASSGATTGLVSPLTLNGALGGLLALTGFLVGAVFVL